MLHFKLDLFKVSYCIVCSAYSKTTLRGKQHHYYVLTGYILWSSSAQNQAACSFVIHCKICYKVNFIFLVQSLTECSSLAGRKCDCLAVITEPQTLASDSKHWSTAVHRCRMTTGETLEWLFYFILALTVHYLSFSWQFFPEQLIKYF